MSSLGVRELKANLSSSLKRVQAGERLTVTDRGRAIAVIVPAQSRPSLDWLHTMVAEGRAYWSGGKPTGLAKPIKSRRSGKTASQMVIEDRG